MKCQNCPGFETCIWRDPETDECFYEPNDYDGHDIGTATIIELKHQNNSK